MKHWETSSTLGDTEIVYNYREDYTDTEEDNTFLGLLGLLLLGFFINN